MRLLVLGLLVLLAGCTRELGYAGKNPGAVQCSGKATITITGAAAIGPGGTETGDGTVIFDCGSGAYLEQGLPSITAPPPGTISVPAASPAAAK